MLKYIIAFIGLASVTGIFIGSSVALLIWGYEVAFKVLIANILIFAFAVILTDTTY